MTSAQTRLRRGTQSVLRLIAGCGAFAPLAAGERYVCGVGAGTTPELMELTFWSAGPS